MKATITYDLPEELSEFLVHLKGQSYLVVLWDLDQELRQKVKYGQDAKEADWAEKMREYIREELADHGCSLEDGE